MNESPLGMPREPTPDFAWPFRIAELIFEWLSAAWERFTKQLEALGRRCPRFVVQAALWSCVTYVGLVWISLCYIRYPVAPYGLWDVGRG